MRKKLNLATLAVVSVLMILSITFYIIMGLYALTTRILFSASLVSVILYASINYKWLAGFFRRSGTLTGITRSLQILIISGILVFIYIFSISIPWKIDLTASRIYSLSGETLSMLKNLTNDVKAYYFKSPDKTDSILDYQENLLKIYSERSEHIKIKFIDPNSDRTTADDYNITENGTVVFEYQGSRAYVGIRKIFSSDPQSGKLLYKGEAAYTSAIKSVISSKPPNVYILQGHGEINPFDAGDNGYSGILDQMKNENITVKILSFLKFPDMPHDCGTLIIGNPTHSLTAEEQDKISNFIDSGGSVLILLGLETHETVNYPLNQMGLHYSLNLAIEDQDYAVQYGKTTILPQIIPDEITMPLIRNNLHIIMPMAVGIDEIPQDYRASNDLYIIKSFLRTSKDSYGVVSIARIRSGEVYNDTNADNQGPLTLGCSVRRIQTNVVPASLPKTNTIESRMIVFGDNLFINNTYYNTGGDSDLFLNSINYLLKRDTEITIRPKSTEIAGFQLSSSEQRLLSVISIALFLVYIIPGIVIVIRRRNRVKS
jgi:hypothetical protein